MSKKIFLSVGECMIEMSSLVDNEFQLNFAGDTFNTAWYTRACLPMDQWDVSYFTRIGTDDFSLKMKSFFNANHIDTRFIQEDPVRQPGLYLIEVKDGERHFTYWRDQSAAKRLAEDTVLLEQAFSQADVIYFSAITLAILLPEHRDHFIKLVKKARESGKTTVFDTNIRLRLWQSKDELKRITMQAANASEIVLPSFDDEAKVFGDLTLEDCAQRYLNAGASVVVLKNGGDAMLVADGKSTQYFSDFEQLKPLDTTGAGDSFNGGFLAALLTGHNVETAMINGHNVASQVVMQRGALMPMHKIKLTTSAE